MNKLIKEGWVTITENMCQGNIVSWRTQDEKTNIIPLVFDTVENAWKYIAEDMIENLQQFIEGARELDETLFASEDSVATYQEFKDGSFCISDEEGNPIIETTLEEWRKSL